MGGQWAQSKPSEYQQNQREGGKLESHLQKMPRQKVNKCIYQGIYFEKNPSIISPKNTNIYFGGYESGKSKKQNTSVGSPNTKWYTERVTTENIQQRHYCQVCVKNWTAL